MHHKDGFYSYDAKYVDADGADARIPADLPADFDAQATRNQHYADLAASIQAVTEEILLAQARAAVERGATSLINITNDAWYGKSSAPYQTLAMAAMRSAETKVPMIRVANTGVSAVIKPSGEITYRTPLFKRGTEIEEIAWRPTRTVYTIVGDLFAEICFAMAAIAMLVAWRWPRRTTSRTSTWPRARARASRRC